MVSREKASENLIVKGFIKEGCTHWVAHGEYTYTGLSTSAMNNSMAPKTRRAHRQEVESPLNEEIHLEEESIGEEHLEEPSNEDYNEFTHPNNDNVRIGKDLPIDITDWCLVPKDDKKELLNRDELTENTSQMPPGEVYSFRPNNVFGQEYDLNLRTFWSLLCFAKKTGTNAKWYMMKTCDAFIVLAQLYSSFTEGATDFYARPLVPS
ncbi:hypothetical protein M9H77_07043 [Catharanthus roseus]|uniref:Uncharacterized protein n=1 Tax=Catharanthus roseus TaxID=4058 RepID=A0ACC0BU71_CATRO|nr:hypothetical protein M9H77_07043 [Catharanthus roseus]